MEIKENKLLNLLNIHPGEGRLVALVLLYAILLYIGNVLLRTASYALFVSVYDAQTLPYVYIGIAIFGPLITLLYLRMTQTYSLAAVLVGVHVVLFLTLVAFWVGLGSLGADWLYFSLPIYFGVINSVEISSFWNLLGRIYNLQQGKRLFGMLSSGEHIATVLTGFLAPVLIAWIGTVNLYLAAALLMLPTLGLLWYIIRTNAEMLAEPEAASAEPARQEKPKGIWKDSYVRLIFTLFSLFIVGVYFTDNIFYSQAQIRYPTEDELGSFIGVFFGVLGFLSLIIQFFVAGRLLNRFGVRAMILATPLGVLLIMAAFAFFGTFTTLGAVVFWLAVAGNMYRLILDAVDSAAVNLMYQPLPARDRTQAQTTVMGIIYPLSIGLAGVLLLVLIDVFSLTTTQVSYVLLVIAGFWLFTGIRLGRAYPKRLKEALQKRILGGISIPQLDRSSLAVFQDGLESAQPGVVLYSLEMVAAIAPEQLKSILPGLLEHPNIEVRRAALNLAAQHRLEFNLDTLRKIIQNEASPDLRAAAIETLAILDDPQALSPFLGSYLDAAPLPVRRAAFIGLLKHDRFQGTPDVWGKLAQLSQSADPAERSLAAEVLGKLAHQDRAPREGGSLDIQALLAALLEDSDTGVRRAAIMAAGYARYTDLWPQVIAALGMPDTRSAAAAAMAAGGEAILPGVKSAFEDPQHRVQILIPLARVLKRMPTNSLVMGVCWEYFRHPDSAVRTRLLAALSKQGFQADSKQKPEVEAQIQDEITQAAGVIAALAQIETGDSVRLLRTALDRKLTLLQTNLYYLLSFLYDSEAVLTAWRVLCFEAGAAQERKAYAVETLDILLDVSMKTRLWPFLDDLPVQKRWQQLGKAFPLPDRSLEDWLRVFIAPGAGTLDDWIRVCALFTVGKRPAPGPALIGQMADWLQQNELPALEWETAAVSLYRLDALLQAADQVRLRERMAAGADRAHIPMTTVEKVETLGQVEIFSDTSAEVLVDVALLLVEQEVEPGTSVIRKGDAGDCMYLIVSGRLRVHDGDATFNHLEAGQIFGEMALLETAPRMASVTALEHTHLLRLDQDPFYELMDGRAEIVRGVIKVLSQRVRRSVSELVQRGTAVPPPVLPTASRQGGVEAAFPLSLPEKVLILKTVDLFKKTPDDVLYPLASLLIDIELGAGEVLFKKGDSGDAMYIVFDGEIWIHDSGQTLNRLEAGAVFGEMALLDHAPRLATAAALQETRLLRLDRAPFFELMEDRIEVGHGVIRVLSGFLRTQINELVSEE